MHLQVFWIIYSWCSSFLGLCMEMSKGNFNCAKFPANLLQLHCLTKS